MITSPAGVKAIEGHEGLELTAYQDVAGHWTIGFGHIGSQYAFEGSVITRAKATKLLKEDLKDAENAVNRYVKVPLNQKQFDSLVSLVFNIGAGAFARSTLLKKLNNKDYLGAADEFPKWRRAGNRVIRGLVIRRAKERIMFLEGTKDSCKAHLPSNLEPDIPAKEPISSSKPIQALGATTVAGTLAAGSEMAAPLAGINDYLMVLWVVLSVAAIVYFIYSRKED